MPQYNFGLEYMYCHMYSLLRGSTPHFLQEELYEVTVNIPTLNIEQGGRWAFIQVKFEFDLGSSVDSNYNIITFAFRNLYNFSYEADRHRATLEFIYLIMLVVSTTMGIRAAVRVKRSERTAYFIHHSLDICLHALQWWIVLYWAALSMAGSGDSEIEMPNDSLDTSNRDAIRETLTFLVDVGTLMQWYRVYQYLNFIGCMLMMMKLLALVSGAARGMVG